MEGTRLPAITISSSLRSPNLSTITGIPALNSSRPTLVHSHRSQFSLSNYDVHHHSRTSAKHWDKFYQRHQNKFFKDRHYLEKDWANYFSGDGDAKVILEVGCGAGNTIFPLVKRYPKLFVHACDFSPHAVALFKSHTAFTDDKINAFVCNVAEDNICDYVMPSSVDVVTLVFMLSAVSPEEMPFIVQNLKKVLKPNGCILLRDYATGDFAQVKLQDRDQMISENFFFRGDGTFDFITRGGHYGQKESYSPSWMAQKGIPTSLSELESSFYFSEDFLSTLFMKAGFTVVHTSTYCKDIENRSRNIIMPRRWVRAVFSML